MGSNHQTTQFDRARDELCSHVIRCDVLEAHMEDRLEWLEETMDYMADRYPDLTELELAQLEVVGRRFVKPAIPHGSHAHAGNRDRWQVSPDEEAEAPLEQDANLQEANLQDASPQDAPESEAEPLLAGAT